MTDPAPFAPVNMPVGVLTAALQELTPRERRDPDPDLAVEEWLDFAKALDADCIELSAALHPSLADVPAEAMLDPVANTLDLREPFNEVRAKRVLAAVDDTGVAIADVAYFDDMLHEDPAIRRKKHDFMILAMDAAVLLGVPAVTGFVGRDQSKSMDQNLIEFENSFVPLLQEAKDRGLQYRVEQCPMPGWTPSDNFHNNIGYAPGMWIALHQICERHGVGDQFRIHYDPSHAILMGQDTRSLFQYLADAGYGFLIAGMHVKGQVVDAKGVAGWGYGGQTVQRGDWVDGEVSANPADLANAWKKQTVLCEHELPGHGAPRPARLPAEPHRRLARPPARRPRVARLRPGDHAADRRARVRRGAGAGASPARADPRGSIAFTRHIDEAAAAMYALQHEVLAAQGIPVQGDRAARRTGADTDRGRRAGRSARPTRRAPSWPTSPTSSAARGSTSGGRRRARRRTTRRAAPSRPTRSPPITPTEPRRCAPTIAARRSRRWRSPSRRTSRRARDVAGIIGIGGSGGTALITPAMQALPVGIPKVMVSTVASGNVAPYVGAADIAMMYSVTDVAGLNRISRVVLGNAANAVAGMAANPVPPSADRPARRRADDVRGHDAARHPARRGARRPLRPAGVPRHRNGWAIDGEARRSPG